MVGARPLGGLARLETASSPPERDLRTPPPLYTDRPPASRERPAAWTVERMYRQADAPQQSSDRPNLTDDRNVVTSTPAGAGKKRTGGGRRRRDRAVRAPALDRRGPRLMRPGALGRNRLELPARRRLAHPGRALPCPYRGLGRGAVVGSRRCGGRGRRGRPPRGSLADGPDQRTRRSPLCAQPQVALLLLQAGGLRRRHRDCEGRGIRLGRRRYERLGHTAK